ncbi:DUF5615 family PIN-like protein [bacterium]|nr:DUF5615 family PIN-like protein [bacterium]
MGNKKQHSVDYEHYEELRLPFPSGYFIDANLPEERLKKALGCWATTITTTHDVDLSEASDATISSFAGARGEWVITRDRTFHYDSVRAGTIPLGVVIVPEEKTRSYSNFAELSSAIEERCRPLSLYAPADTTIVVDLRRDTAIILKLDVPPADIRCILPLLDSRPGLPTKDLATAWHCSVRTALRKARQFSYDRWLRVAKKGRRNMYFRGARIEAFLEMGTIDKVSG